MFSASRHRPRVVPYRHHPKLRWTIAGCYVNGKRVRRFFYTKGEAETYLLQFQVKAENLGVRATAINPNLHIMAIECSDRLATFDRTIADATDFYVRHLESVARSCGVEELFDRFQRDKTADGISRRYVGEIRSRLGRFTRDFSRRSVATITSTEIDDWLRRLQGVPLTRNNYRRLLHTFFAYAVRRRLCNGNPVTETEKARVRQQAVEVLTPEEVERLLAAAACEVVPIIAIGAFAGLRPAEIARLDWKEIRLERGFIEVTAHKAKTASRRLVSIQPNLAAWLQPYRNERGPVTPPNGRKLIDATRIRAGFEDWPSNGLRHSFASYHLAKFQDAPALALQLGHTTTAVLFAHYREVVTPEDAAKYWQVVPSPRAQEQPRKTCQSSV